MNKTKKSVLYSVIVLILIALSFYGGMQYQKTGNGTKNTNRSQLPGMGAGGAGGRNAGGFTTGEIVSLDDQSLTIKMPNGSTKIVFYSAKTPLAKQSTATLEDLKAGETVTVVSTANPDGSVTAKNIQIGKVIMNTPPSMSPPAV